MGWPIRIEFPGAFYPVVLRGNQRQDVFIDDQDRSEYLNRFKRCKKEQFTFASMTPYPM